MLPLFAEAVDPFGGNNHLDCQEDPCQGVVLVAMKEVKDIAGKIAVGAHRECCIKQVCAQVCARQS